MLTAKNIQNLYMAIDLAEEPGKCSYLCGNKPQCVIGQLAVLENVSLDKIKKWNMKRLCHIKSFTPQFKRYTVELLSLLQEMWDTGPWSWDSAKMSWVSGKPNSKAIDKSTNRKNAMRKLVDQYLIDHKNEFRS